MQEANPQNTPSTFRDNLVNDGLSSPESQVTYEEICAANPTPIFTVMEDPISGVEVKVPEIYIPNEIHDKLCLPWKNSVFIKLLENPINFFTLRAILQRDWKTASDSDIIDIGLGYYVVRFRNAEDCEKVLTGGPYKIYDHYLVVQPWEPNFQPYKAKMPKTVVWVHLQTAPMEQFQEPILKYIANTLGK